MLMPKKILVPTDFSKYSDRALKQALDIAVEYHAAVHVLHVVDSKLRSTMDEGAHLIVNADEIRALERGFVTMARERLREQIAKFPESKEVKVTQRVTTGLPAEEILRDQQRKGVDLIVIASLGQSGIAKYLIGSVARNVLKGAKCPVLLTK